MKRRLFIQAMSALAFPLSGLYRNGFDIHIKHYGPNACYICGDKAAVMDFVSVYWHNIEQKGGNANGRLRDRMIELCEAYCQSEGFCAVPIYHCTTLKSLDEGKQLWLASNSGNKICETLVSYSTLAT